MCTQLPRIICDVRRDKEGLLGFMNEDGERIGRVMRHTLTHLNTHAAAMSAGGGLGNQVGQVLIPPEGFTVW
jgi:hypothetical protein